MPTQNDLSGRAAEVLRNCEVTWFDLDSDRVPLLIPQGVYRPDVWTRQTLTGLKQYLLDRESPHLCIEVGVGSGIIPLFLDRWISRRESARYLGLDISAVACETARINFEINELGLDYTLIPGGDLFELMPSHNVGAADVILANIPQVPTFEGGLESRNDYYHLRGRNDPNLAHFDMCGLGLIYDLLEQSKAFLSPGGSVVFTLASRCHHREIERMFAASAMRYHIAATSRVAQDHNTMLSSFARYEASGNAEYIFYSTPRSSDRIDAKTASQRVEAGDSVYYDLHVVFARR